MAMRIKKTKGAKEVSAKLATVSARLVPKLRIAIHNTCLAIQKHAQDNHGKDAHEAKRYSNQSGELSRSIVTSLVHSSTARSIRGEVRATKEYAAAIEFGTARNRPYPFMFPALLVGRQVFKQEASKLKVTIK